MSQETTGRDYTTSIFVSASAERVFAAVNDVRGWWSENIEGDTDRPGAEFIYSYKDVHACKMRITAFEPGRQVVWKVLENRFSFTQNKSEWMDNDIIFDISPKDGGTELRFTQKGLVPEYECYDVCRDAWTSYIQGSLKDLTETGTGKPNTRDHDLNGELVQKWGLPDR